MGRWLAGAVGAALAGVLVLGGIGVAPTVTLAAPRSAVSWNLAKIDIDRAWAITQGKSSVTVAVIDTGVDETHPGLAGRASAGQDYTTTTGRTQLVHGHGTAVSGVIVGVDGMAPGARVFGMKVFDGNDNTTREWIANAIRDAANRGYKIINMSLGGTSEGSSVMREAIDWAVSNGVLIVASSGNGNRQDLNNGAVTYPAGHPGVLAVGSTTWDDTIAAYSTRGKWVRLAAPGGDSSQAAVRDPRNLIRVPVLKGEYDYWQGTSFAAPHVAGLAALIWSANPTLSRDAVADIMMKTADARGSDERPNPVYGWGRINAGRAVRAALPREWALTITTPTDGAPAGGAAVLNGFVIEKKTPDKAYGDLIETVEVYLDGKPDAGGQLLGRARYGAEVPAGTVDGAPNDAAFTFALDPAALAPGPHTLWVSARSLFGETVWQSISLSAQ